MAHPWYVWFRTLRTGQTMVAKYVLALFLGACLSTATHGAEFGLVQLDGAGHAILILGSKVPPGSKISFQFERSEGGPGCCKELLSRDLVEIDSTELLVSNEVTDDAVWAYRARIPKLWAVSPFIGAAYIGKSRLVQGRGELLEVRDVSGRMRKAGTCVSQEGVHLIERVGKTVQTHLYFSVGYEVEKPTCR